MSFKQSIQELAAGILDGRLDRADLAGVFKVSNIPYAREMETASGLVLGSRDAAECLYDLERTRKLLAGLLKVLEEENPSHLIEAGSGPLPITFLAAALLPKGKVHVTAIDYHPESVGFATTYAEQLGLSAHIDCLQADLTCDDLSGLKPDLVLIEAMNTGLLIEPQGAIEAHLAQQWGKVHVLPEKITVTALLCEDYTITTNIDGLIILGQLVQLNDDFREAARRGEQVLHTRKMFTFDPLPRKRLLCLKTEVGVTAGFTINSGESSITCPRWIVRHLAPSGASRVTVDHCMGAKLLEISFEGG